MIGRSVYTGYSKSLPPSFAKRLAKLRIGGLHKKKAPPERSGMVPDRALFDTAL
jgi:hypothetical protein